MEQLERIAVDIEACSACELGKSAIHKVVGSGEARPGCVFFLGEAPGANEDKTGEPFVGSAGTRLEALLTLAGLSRKAVFIGNVLKCRPPKNRDPRAAEVEACSKYLRAQLEAIRPSVVVSMGNFATKFMLGSDVSISEVRGTFHNAGTYQVFPVFHPAAAIYDRAKQPVLEQDFLKLGAYLAERGQHA